MSEEERIKLFKRIENGTRIARIRMLKRKALLGESVIVADENGKPIKITAEESLRNTTIFPEGIN